MPYKKLAILEEQNLRLREENELLRQALDGTECGRQLLHQRDKFTRLIKLGKDIVAELDTQKVLAEVAEAARELVDAEMLLVPIIEADRKKYTYLATSGPGSADMLGASFKIGVGMCGWVLKHQRPLLFGEPDEWWMDEKTQWEKGQQSALLVPLIGEKQIIGGLSGIGKAGGGSFTMHDLDVLNLFANQVSAAIENAKLFQELEDKSNDLMFANRRLESEIQERLQTEATLRESEERYREIYNSPSDAIFIHDAETGAILDVNRAMLEMYGYDYKEARQLNVGPYNQEEAAKLIRHRQAALNEPQTFEWLCRKKDGSLFWVEVALKLARIGARDYVIASVRDITERREAAAALAAEREQLAVTLRSIGDGVIATDTNENIVVLNKVAEELTGWTNQEAMGKPFREIFHIVNEQTRLPCEDPVEKVLAEGQIVGLANHTVLIARDGTEHSIADSGAPIRDASSRLTGVVIVFRDVTEQNRIEKELLKVQKLESVGMLAGGIAHDFNNILAAILGNLSLSLLDKGIGSSTKKFLHEAEKASLRARDLTQQLLTFSKGGAPVKEEASLSEVIRDSADFILRGKAINCQYSFPEDLWSVEIDKGQISQVIQNIVLNACQAIAGSGIIRISCCNSDGIEERNFIGSGQSKFVKISISDEGIGIPENVMDKIFDPYFSTKKEGSGLGLAICHSIISKHDGEIFVSSTPGAGTTFTIYLPASSTKRGKTVAAKTTSASVDHKAKILVMDDDKMVLEVVQAMFGRLGHEVVPTEDGLEAIEVYRKDGPTIDLVIMDLTIPGGMGGKEAVHEILQINPDAKVVVSSGYSNDPIMANYKEHGFCAALVKPYQLHELSKIITEFIQ